MFAMGELALDYVFSTNTTKTFAPGGTVGDTKAASDQMHCGTPLGRTAGVSFALMAAYRTVRQALAATHS